VADGANGVHFESSYWRDYFARSAKKDVLDFTSSVRRASFGRTHTTWSFRCHECLSKMNSFPGSCLGTHCLGGSASRPSAHGFYKMRPSRYRFGGEHFPHLMTTTLSPGCRFSLRWGLAMIGNRKFVRREPREQCVPRQSLGTSC